MNGVSIRSAINLTTSLPVLVAQATLNVGEGFIGFHYSEVSESWEYWISNSNEASASNCYYTKQEAEKLLASAGYSYLLGETFNVE